MKLDAITKIGVLKQFTFEERIAEYKTWPVEYQADPIKEAEEYHAKGMICMQFTTDIEGDESVIQWNTPSQFIKNCYDWFIKE